MRSTAFAISALMLGLTACSSESTQTSYVGTSSMDAAQVQQLLRNQGYTDISNLHKNGNDWVGSALANGRPVAFDIDQNGVVHTK